MYIGDEWSWISTEFIEAYVRKKALATNNMLNYIHSEGLVYTLTSNMTYSNRRHTIQVYMYMYMQKEIMYLYRCTNCNTISCLQLQSCVV